MTRTDQEAFLAGEFGSDCVARELESLLHDGHVWSAPIGEYSVPRVVDLVFIKGVLIHIHTDQLPETCDVLYRSAARCIPLCGYYTPTPVAIDYRGNKDRLSKGDFCGETMERFPESSADRLWLSLLQGPCLPAGRHRLASHGEAEMRNFDVDDRIDAHTYGKNWGLQ